MRFEEFIEKLPGRKQPAGNGFLAFCPAHDNTKTPALSVSRGDDRILINDKGGNCTAERITSAMGLTLADLFYAPRGGNGTGGPRLGLTLEAFGKAKGFTTDFLSQQGVHEDKNALIFRYLTMDGQKAVRQRLRLSLTGDKKFLWSKADGRPIPYGLWRLEEALKAGVRELILCEGESDALTLWLHGITAVGIPGADTCSILQAAHVAGFRRTLIVRENDHGGEIFEKGCVGRLAELEFDGKVAVVEMEKAAAKDPNELHVKLLSDANAFESEWGALTLQARAVELPIVGVVLNEWVEHPRRIEWLWKDRVPLGNVAIYGGAPGRGKSLATLDLAARVSTGVGFPDGARGVGPARVLMISAEDGFETVMQHRLQALGADLSRVLPFKSIAAKLPDGQIGEHGFNAAADLPHIDRLLKKWPDIRLITIDPLTAFLGRVDSYKDAEMRGMVMAPLFTLAEKFNVAIVLVAHLNKGAGSPLNRISGSIGITAAARMVWGFVPDPEQPDEPDQKRKHTLMLPVKLNLAANIGGLAYSIVSSTSDPEVATLVWENRRVHDRIEDVFAAEAEQHTGAGASKLEAAKAVWLEMLAAGPRPVSEVEKRSREMHISDSTLNRARRDLRLECVKSGFGDSGQWTAKLPAPLYNS